MANDLYACDRCAMRYSASPDHVLGRSCICGGSLKLTTPEAQRHADLAKLLDTDQPLEQLKPKIEKLLKRQ